MSTKTALELDCIKSEMEYREWLKSPLWYCVKTTFDMKTGETKRDFVRDEKTNLPITIQSTAKPQDGVFEDASGTAYYNYYRDYEEAVRQVATAKV